MEKGALIGAGRTAGYLDIVTNAPFEGRSFWALAENGQPENNIILVYDKKNAWGIFKGQGWGLKAIGIFRNQLVGMDGTTLVRLMTGTTDLGNLIVGKAITGYAGSEPRGFLNGSMAFAIRPLKCTRNILNNAGNRDATTQRNSGAN